MHTKVLWSHETSTFIVRLKPSENRIWVVIVGKISYKRYIYCCEYVSLFTRLSTLHLLDSVNPVQIPLGRKIYSKAKQRNNIDNFTRKCFTSEVKVYKT